MKGTGMPPVHASEPGGKTLYTWFRAFHQPVTPAFCGIRRLVWQPSLGLLCSFVNECFADMSWLIVSSCHMLSNHLCFNGFQSSNHFFALSFTMYVVISMFSIFFVFMLETRFQRPSEFESCIQQRKTTCLLRFENRLPVPEHRN